MSSPPALGAGRETRLLLLVIIVAVAVLLVLARFRYPSVERVAPAPVVGPIERLAARATFEELSLIMADLTARVQPSLLAITLERVPVVTPARRGAPPPVTPPERRRVAAWRIDVDLAVAYVPAGFTPVDGEGAVVAARDDARSLALLRVPVAPYAGPGPLTQSFGGPSYVAVFEGGRGGAAGRPVFVGRIDTFEDDQWPEPLLAVGGRPGLDAGAFVFTLDGRLLGMTLPDDAGTAIVRASMLQTVVERLRTQ